MVLVGLLLALVCLVVGIALASSAWLVASLAATAAAGLLLWRTRASRSHPTRSRVGAHTLAAQSSAGSTLVEHPVVLPGGGAVAPPAPPVGAQAVVESVWVVDGRPLYHRAGCALLKDLPAEAITLAQATEDGFLRCSLCEPKSVRIT